MCVCVCVYVFSGFVQNSDVPPPVKNWTIITLFLEELSWNDAVKVCEAQGGKILDITCFSIFGHIVTMTAESPWADLPLA